MLGKDGENRHVTSSLRAQHLALVLHKCLLAIVTTFKGSLSLTGRDVPRIETRIPITTDKIIHFLEVMAKNPKISH